ncbi:nucleoside triphosphate pyrophosphohydrolase [Zobellella taiwanensis]|jgi:ATP diphosphatase|uniref:Nucleoside triphosphate pyrophosphohydrolase n=1 Tax=Zobellella taiwanensis TaxID=347535 RepID=A0A2P7QMX7_9GAMM|nr:nucleoside triphosphate pyrophosphohydrolase [Zobellella taiwanensis]PSJ39324.1 nucleoside triphosphate pyrophosphohydrolase [Zobellella taiwanensis]
MEKHHYSLSDLLAIMAALRDPESGCPWDLRQDFASIVPHTLEEAYEVADTIERGALAELPGELGDLLFQVVFYSRLGEECSLFNFGDVVQAISHKLVARHPHVFGNADFDSEEQVKANWEHTKAEERRAKDAAATSALDDIPRGLPALSRANKIQKRCAAVGFDWRELPPVVDKIREELDEVLEEVNQHERDPDRIADELGDLLFATVNLVRHLKQDPEAVLRRANDKFERRFRAVEQALRADGKDSRGCSLEELDSYWNRVKCQES